MYQTTLVVLPTQWRLVRRTVAGITMYRWIKASYMVIRAI